MMMMMVVVVMMMMRRWTVIRKAALAILVALGISMPVFGLNDAWASQPPDHKVTLCHRTDSNTNPYVQITVDVASVLNGHGHAGHTGPIWSAGLKAQHIKWGDIIPKFTYGGVTYPGMNVAAANPSVPDGDRWLANGCKNPGPLVTPPITPPGTPPVTPGTPATAAAGSTIAPAPSTAAIPGAATVHTGEPWAGSLPYSLAIGALGAGLVVLGLVRRRFAR